jgi:hypothetical protein
MGVAWLTAVAGRVETMPQAAAVWWVPGSRPVPPQRGQFWSGIRRGVAFPDPMQE